MSATETPVRADGLMMLTVPARDLEAGDLVPLGGAWSEVVTVSVDAWDEPAIAYIATTGQDGEHTTAARADAAFAILRPATAHTAGRV